MDCILLKHAEFEPKINDNIEQHNATQELENSRANGTLMVHNGKLWICVFGLTIQIN